MYWIGTAARNRNNRTRSVRLIVMRFFRVTSVTTKDNSRRSNCKKHFQEFGPNDSCIPTFWKHLVQTSLLPWRTNVIQISRVITMDTMQWHISWWTIILIFTSSPIYQTIAKHSAFSKCFYKPWFTLFQCKICKEFPMFFTKCTLHSLIFSNSLVKKVAKPRMCCPTEFTVYISQKRRPRHNAGESWATAIVKMQRNVMSENTRSLERERERERERAVFVGRLSCILIVNVNGEC